MKKFVSILLVVLMMSTMFVGTAFAAPKEFVSIATATMSGTYYGLGTSLSSVLNEKMPGYNFSAESTSGGGQNIEYLRNGEVEIAFCDMAVAGPAYAGTGNYEGKAYEDCTAIATIYGLGGHILVREDADINSIEDLKGKRMSVGAAGSSVEAICRMVMQAAGINYWEENDFTAEYIAVTESIEAIKNGQIDALFMTGPDPMPVIVDACNSADIKLLDIDGEIAEKLMESYPMFYPLPIPAGTYKGQDEEVTIVAVAACIIADASCSEEMIYDLTKNLWEQREALTAQNNVWGAMTEETITNGIIVPVHPGAEKYYKEIGLM